MQYKLDKHAALNICIMYARDHLAREPHYARR